MSFKQYEYSEGDAAWWATFLARCERQSKGYIGLSLTNFTTSTVCAIAAGSVVEIDGAVFIASAETSVTGSIATGLNYIICSVTGTEANPYWSQTGASTYDTAKQGFYHATERYVAGCNSDNGSTYDNKWVYGENVKSINSTPTNAILPKVKISNDSRNTSGVQVIAGIGFTASLIIFHAADGSGGQENLSQGADDGIVHNCVYYHGDGTLVSLSSTYSIVVDQGSGNDISGYVSDIGADDYTITWALNGTQAVKFIGICFP